MPTDETEWSLQKRLTTNWLEHDVVVLKQEPFFLAAWEVMTNYRVNDSRRHWNRPSIDFLFLDRAGCMVLLELKREVRTPRDAWSVVCQVTHRAHLLAASYSQSRLEEAYFDCHSGADGRMSASASVANLAQAHAKAFKQPPLRVLPGLPVRRFVMAKAFGPSFAPILSSMNCETTEQVTARLGRYRPRGEIARYLNLPEDARTYPAPIQAITIEG